jgi:hypothetical protein
MGTLISSTAISSALASLFGYLKYRSYLRFVQHIAGCHGLQPSTIVIPMARRSEHVLGDVVPADAGQCGGSI